MRPKLSKNSTGAMAILGRKKPAECDLFERTVGMKVTNLSMSLEQGNALIAELESQLEEAREKSIKEAGEYGGWCEALASYYASQQAEARGEAGIPVSAKGGAMPGPLDVKVTLDGGQVAKVTAKDEAPTPATEEPQGEAPATDKPQDEAPEPGATGPDEPGTDATDPKAEPQG